MPGISNADTGGTFDPSVSLPSAPSANTQQAIDLAASTMQQPTLAAPPAPSFLQQAVTAVPSPLSALPDSVGQFLQAGPSASTTPVVQTLPANVKSLQNKWADPDIQQAVAKLKPPQVQALQDLDAQRVQAGQAPLTRNETLGTAQTLLTGTPATPVPARSPLNVPGNILSNLGDLVKSVPQIPMQLLHEVTHLGETGHTGNAIADVLTAPGVRLIPGAFTAANLAQGGKGLANLARNPLFTALDLLPGASKLAEGSEVVKAAQEAADLSGGKVRPLGVLATRMLDDSGQVVPNKFGDALAAVRNDTKIGQAVDTAFGGRARDIARTFSGAQQHVDALQSGALTDDTGIADLTRQARDLAVRANDLGWDQAKLSDLAKRATTGTSAALSGLGADELAYIHDARDLAHQFADKQMGPDGLAQHIDPVNGDAELYPAAQAKKFDAAKTRADYMGVMSDMRRQYLSQPDQLAATPLTPDAITQMHDAANDPRFTAKQRKTLTGGLQNVLEAHGYDGKAVVADLNTATDRAAVLPGHTPKQLLPLDEILTKTDAWRHADGAPDMQVRDLSRALADRNVSRIKQALGNLQDRTRYASPTADSAFGDTVDSLARRYKADSQLTGAGTDFSEKAAVKARAQYDNLVANHPPARFGPLLSDARDSVFADRAQAKSELAVGRKLNPDEAGNLVQAVQQRRWDAAEQYGVSSDQLRRLYDNTSREVASTWQDLKQAGADPVFEHNVSVNRARTVDNPRVGPTPNSISSTKERNPMNMAPGVGDLAVSLNHQGLELLTRRASEEAMAHIAEKYGMSRSDLAAVYTQQAQDMAARNPALSLNGHLDRLINRSYSRLPNQEAYASLGKYGGDDIYLPKAVANNIDAMSRPSGPITGLMNKLSNTFRVSVVALSPRSLLYHTLGGTTMAFGEMGPEMFKYMGEANEWRKNPDLIPNDWLRATVGSAKRDILDKDLLARPQVLASQLAGRTLGRITEQIQQSRALGGMRDMFGRVVDKSLSVHGIMDDMYRTVGYLYGKDKAYARSIAAGGTEDVARAAGEKAGMELAQKVMMDWTSITPFERSTVKAIFPFYSFMNHVMRYALRYPADHPLSAAIIGGFGRAEVADGGLLPASFLGSFMFGSTDSHGNRKSIDLKPINPFGDIANTMTLSGFLSATNPAISAVLQSVGVKAGSAELYPTLRYDPETGKLTAQHSNPLLNLVQDTIPQSQVLTSLLGMNQAFKQRMAADPAGATRFLTSAIGLPLPIANASAIYRTVNPTQEIAANEVAREKSQASVKAQALTSGDWTNALSYPGLRDDYQKLRDATPEQLAQFQPAGVDVYSSMIAQAYGRQKQQADINGALTNSGAATTLQSFISQQPANS